MRSGTGTLTREAGGPVWVAQVFLFSLLVPFYLPIGTLVLMPHRIVLLLAFVPMFLQLFVFRRAGPVLIVDWLLFGSALWAGLALAANHPLGRAIEPFGIHVIEFFGAYLLARVAIRSSADHIRMVRTFFLIALFLLPFAALESFLRRAVLLDILPGTNVRPVNAGVRLGLRRAQTVFAHPILFGVFMSAGLGLFWYIVRPRSLRFLAALVVVLGTFFSLSTGALIALVVQTGLIGWEIILKTVRRRWLLFVILVVVGYILIDLLSARSPFHVLVTYGTFYQASAYNRILIWEFGTQNVWNNPIFGLGLNDWVRPSWMGSSMDNFWLAVTVAYGLPAFGMFASAIVIVIRRLSKAALTTFDDKAARAGYLTTLGGIIVAGGTVHFWHAALAFVMLLLGSGIWMISGGAATSDDTPQTDPEKVTRLSPYTRQNVSGEPIRQGATSSVQRASAHRRARRSRTGTGG